MSSNVPVPATKVPLLVKLPATSSEDGPFKVPEIVMCLKFVAELPAIEEVPLNITVPLVWEKVPLFVQFPATLKEPAGAVREPLIKILLNEEVLLPLIVVVPPKVTVALPVLSVPLFTKLPLTLMFAEGVNVPVMVIPPNVGADEPLNTVVPLNVNALEVSVLLELLTKFPFRSTGFDPASNKPLLIVKIPLTVTAP